MSNDEEAELLDTLENGPVNSYDNRSYNDYGSEDSSGGSSSLDSFCCDSNCEECIPEWDSEVEPNGELYYIKIVPLKTTENISTKTENLDNSKSKKSNKKNTKREKLVKFVRRRKSHKSSKKCGDNSNTSKVTFMDSQEGESKEVILSIGTNFRRNLGRRSTLPESYLGITISTFADKSRIMISGFIPDGPSINQRNIKIGDWLKCINGIAVTIDNIDSVLSSIRLPTDVNLLIQRVAACNVPDTELHTTQEFPVNDKIINNMVDTTGNFLEHSVGVMYLDLSTGSNPPNGNADRVYYCFPKPKEETVLYSIRGAFLTLVHLLPKIVSEEPHSSSILVKNELVHVVYVVENMDVMVLAAPDARCSCMELKHLSTLITRYLKFRFQSLKRCFTIDENHLDLDKFFVKIFKNILKIDSTKNEDENPSSIDRSYFEKVFMYSRWFSLPDDIHNVIDDILNEFEANDFSFADDNQYRRHRKFMIVGTCLYYRGYLVEKHFNQDDQIDVDSYCYLEGLLNLHMTFAVHSLVIWREVFLCSCNYGISDSDNLNMAANRKWYLLLIGQGNSIFATLLETRTSERDDILRYPDELYVDQSQDLLSTIHATGLDETIDRLLYSNTNPQIKTFSSLSSGRSSTSWKSAESLLSFVNSNSNSPSKRSNNNEVTSILKHRGSLETNLFTYSSSAVLPTSGTPEDTSDSISRTTSSIFSDDVAPPVLGRRDQRLKQQSSNNNNSISRNSDSDHSDQDTAGSSQFSLLSDSIQTMLPLPRKITHGEENTLFYYIKVEVYQGIVICPPDESFQMHSILENFRHSVRIIHSMLENTIRQKKMETRSRNFYIPIKEQGILFEYSSNNFESKKSSFPLTYWVIGRLFNKPSMTEVYVCYEDKIPQNLVEMAFMLAF